MASLCWCNNENKYTVSNRLGGYMSKSWSQRSQLIESFKVMDLLKHAHELADQGRSIIHLGAG